MTRIMTDFSCFKDKIDTIVKTEEPYYFRFCEEQINEHYYSLRVIHSGLEDPDSIIIPVWVITVVNLDTAGLAKLIAFEWNGVMYSGITPIENDSDPIELLISCHSAL